MAKLVIGLGNPGEKFARTRHSTGFLVVDSLVKSPEIRNNFGSCRLSKQEGLEAQIATFDRDLVIAKPAVLMNSSGRVVRKLVNEFGVALDDLLLIHDDLDLPLGEYRLQRGRGAAGHKGVESVITSLGAGDFWRLRIGIGRPEGKVGVTDYVLEEFPPRELRQLETLAEEQLIPAVRKWLAERSQQ